MKRYIKMLAILYILTSFQLLSCKKFVEIPIPKNQLLTNGQFQDSIQATSAVVGIYVNMMKSFALVSSNGAITIYSGLASDELYLPSPTANELQFFSNAIPPANSLNANMWSFTYSLIYQANACIEGLDASHTLSGSLKERLIGECKFVRAFLYFHLVNLYGYVPLITSTDYRENQQKARTETLKVYQQIISDLISAKSSLTSTYTSSSRMRPNLFAASALLAKVYLYQKEWAKAEQEATDIISSGTYSLENNLNAVFTPNSQETIWQLQVVLPSRATLEGFSFIPSSTSSRPKYAITSYLLDAFETGDKRKVAGNWVQSNTVSGQTYFYPYKYKQRTNPTAESYKVFRLAEQYLIRAEAKAQQNKLISATSDINIIRNRAGLLSLTLNQDQSQILSAIEQERRVELFCEWGNRWYDLKRTDKASEVLGPIKPDWQITDVFFPIPLNELNLNSNLAQNPGYN
jgi:starch-binding outer membrane protein, SusD/RagB family